MESFEFLPVSREDMELRGWYFYDFLLVTGDAYVDHPSFGTPLIGRVLEQAGFRVALLAQPGWRDAEAFAAMGRPRYGVMLSAGNLDSMVAHYTAARRRRHDDAYSPGNRSGLRPDRAAIVYSNRAKEAFPGLPVAIGGLEASLRRFAHYDYWDDAVRRSELFDARADILMYGMGERSALEIARRLARGEAAETLTDIRGTAYIAKDLSGCPFEALRCPSFEEVSRDKRRYAEAAMLQYDEHDPVRGRAIVQPHGERLLVVNPPQTPLSTEELDAVAALPFTREVHPMYDAVGGVPAIEEVRFSVIHNRGCFGACNFCALAFHQGRTVSSRSHASVIREVEGFTKHPLFKGYVHDVGGPTANFRHPSCKKQLSAGMCKGRGCLFPKPCPNLDASEADYLSLLRELRAIPGVKKVFVRSGVRFDYLLADADDSFLRELVRHHISGQLKVAPEHCSDGALYYMGKPRAETFDRFLLKYRELNEKYGLKQYLVPYLMSSHPGSTLQDAINLAGYLKKRRLHPEQVQDFYPTPGTLSTCMYYTELDPRTMKPVYVAKTPEAKAMQRALLQPERPENRRLVLKALREAGREELIRQLLPPPKPGESGGRPSRGPGGRPPVGPVKPKKGGKR